MTDNLLAKLLHQHHNRAMSTLPESAIERLVKPYRARLARLPECASGAIPTSAEQWRKAVIDAGLQRNLTDISNLLTHITTSIAEIKGGELSVALRDIESRVTSLTENLRLISLLKSSAAQSILEMREAVIAAVHAAFDYAVGTTRAENVSNILLRAGCALEEIISAESQLANDPIFELFGVRGEQLFDAREVPTPSMLLSAFYGRYDELHRRVSPVVEALAAGKPRLERAAEVALNIAGIFRQIPALRAFFQVTKMIDEGIGSAGPAWATPRYESMQRVGRSFSNYQAYVRSARKLKSADSSAERAELMLDMYRRMIEGQLRPTAWTILQLRGRTNRRMPETASLVDMLRSDGSDIAVDAAAAILPPVRNAAAHEDFAWNDKTRKIMVGEDSVDVRELESAIELAYSVVVGVELGWICGRVRWSGLAALFDSVSPSEVDNVIRESDAIAVFGANGLRVQSWLNESGTFTVVLKDWPEKLINPGFQALMWSAIHLDSDTERFVIRLADGRTAVEANRTCLHATFGVWLIARELSFSEMPICTFLPANIYARMAVESEEAAAISGAWIALNSALLAYDEVEFSHSLAARRRHLTRNLHLIVVALRYAIPLISAPAAGPLLRALDLVSVALTEENKGARDRVEVMAKNIERRMLRAVNEVPAPQFLPSLTGRVAGPLSLASLGDLDSCGEGRCKD